MRIISRMDNTRKDLDSVHTLRHYGRPLSLQKNIQEHEVFMILQAYKELEQFKERKKIPHFRRRFIFFRNKTKSPCKVVLKAPFHYKKGKHRLTLFQRRNSLIYRKQAEFHKPVQSIPAFLEEWKKLEFMHIGLESASVPARRTITELHLPIQAKAILHQSELICFN
jgi:hypothetical protein